MSNETILLNMLRTFMSLTVHENRCQKGRVMRFNTAIWHTFIMDHNRQLQQLQRFKPVSYDWHGIRVGGWHRTFCAL